MHETIQTASAAEQAWKTPRLVRLGTIADVAGSKTFSADGPSISHS